jgi:hypothetical protein
MRHHTRRHRQQQSRRHHLLQLRHIQLPIVRSLSPAPWRLRCTRGNHNRFGHASRAGRNCPCHRNVIQNRVKTPFSLKIRSPRRCQMPEIRQIAPV